MAYIQTIIFFILLSKQGSYFAERRFTLKSLCPKTKTNSPQIFHKWSGEDFDYMTKGWKIFAILCWKSARSWLLFNWPFTFFLEMTKNDITICLLTKKNYSLKEQRNISTVSATFLTQNQISWIYSARKPPNLLECNSKKYLETNPSWYMLLTQNTVDYTVTLKGAMCDSV